MKGLPTLAQFADTVYSPDVVPLGKKVSDKSCGSHGKKKKSKPKKKKKKGSY